MQPNLGFYRVDTVQEGDYRHEVRPYTNLAYIGGVDAGVSETPKEIRKVELARRIKRLAKRRFSMVLDLEDGAGRLGMKAVVKAARPNWTYVQSIVLGDEQNWTKSQYVALIHRLLQLQNVYGLPTKPIGVSMNPDQVLARETAYFQALDFVSLWAYRAYEFETRQMVIDRVERMLERTNRPAYLVLEGYLRSGYTSVRPDLSQEVYEHFKADERIWGLTVFAYGRDGGTRDFAELKQVYRDIGRDMGLMKPPEPAADEGL